MIEKSRKPALNNSAEEKKLRDASPVEVPADELSPDEDEMVREIPEAEEPGSREAAGPGPTGNFGGGVWVQPTGKG